MNYFEVLYITKGKRQKKVLQAQNRIDALSKAKSNTQGTIVKITKTSAPADERFGIFKNRLLHATKQNIKMPEIIASFRQLSVMCGAGISIHDSIKEVANATQNRDLRDIFKRIDDDLNAGSSFTDSIKAFKSELGEVTIAMVKLGESTGNMGESLSKLADIQEEIYENRQKFKKAVRYPISLVIAIAVAFTILMVYVVPKFKTIFDRFHAQLPMPTKMLLWFEHALSSYGFYILGIIAIMIVSVKFFYAQNSEFKDFVDKHIIFLYLIGNIIFYSSMSRFCLIFTELVRAGIPISEALDTSLLTVTNTYLNKKLKSVKVSVQRGTSLTEAFRDTNLYESMLIQMIQAGESSGNLDKMLEKVTDYYKGKFSDIIDNISSYIEPILIGFISIMVLLLALGIFMPMWDMAKAVKGG